MREKGREKYEKEGSDVRLVSGECSMKKQTERKLTEEGSDWQTKVVVTVQGYVEDEQLWKLQRSMVGVTASCSDVKAIQEQLTKAGLGEIKIRKIQGRVFLIDIPDEELEFPIRVVEKGISETEDEYNPLLGVNSVYGQEGVKRWTESVVSDSGLATVFGVEKLSREEQGWEKDVVNAKRQDNLNNTSECQVLSKHAGRVEEDMFGISRAEFGGERVENGLENRAYADVVNMGFNLEEVGVGA
ncbi:hypothetical protein GOBAR_DD31541 [Gossypium barbadense]|nr:hypothetical protein GOBAR_DD31541 [Gossypium barbadense]